MRIESVATFLIGLVAGILFRSFADFGGALPVFLLSLSLFLSFFGEGIFGRLTAVFLLAAAVGIFRYDLVDTRDSLHLSQYENRNVSAEALLTDEPKINDKSATLYASVAVSGGQRFNALILTTPYVAYHYGDRLSIYGQLEQVKNFSDSFDYQAYLGKDEIYYQFFQPKITLLSSGNGSYLQEKLFEFKDRFLAHINALISEPESSLLSGIVLGAKSSLDPLLTQAFTRAGLIHIVALSGYNVTVVADAFTKMTWFLPVSLRLSAGAIGIILFTLMTGGSTTAVRAAVMALLAILARATGRVYAAGSALFAAAALMIFYNPKILTADISFQLSFLATFGIIFFTPIIESWLVRLPEKFGLKAALISTLSAELAVSPLILYKIGSFSFVSIPANLLVGPAVPPLMLLGFLIGGSAFLSYFLALPLAVLAYPLLLYVVKIAEALASLPFAAANSVAIPLWLTIAIYIVYLLWLLSVGVRG